MPPTLAHPRPRSAHLGWVRGLAPVVLLMLAWGCASRPILPPNAADLTDRYYLPTCPQCGGWLGASGASTDVIVGVREFRFCSAACTEYFQRDPETATTRVDRALIADQLPFYPLQTSITTGRPLPEAPIDFIWGNRLFRAADQADKDRILRDPLRALAALDRAVLDAQRATYPIPNACPVQGAILPNESRIDIVVANRMVRVCCMRCAKVVRSRPGQYLAMIDYAHRDPHRRE